MLTRFAPTERHDIPHEPGQHMVFGPVSFDTLRDAREAMELRKTRMQTALGKDMLEAVIKAYIDEHGLTSEALAQGTTDAALTDSAGASAGTVEGEPSGTDADTAKAAARERIKKAAEALRPKALTADEINAPVEWTPAQLAAARDPNNYDVAPILAEGIRSWSYTSDAGKVLPVTLVLVKTLDERTAFWAAQHVLRKTVENPAEAKNAE